MKPAIHIKRAYEPHAKTDGFRVLVDRLWPRGIKKEDAAVGEWAKDLAPTNELRKWFGHDPTKWPEFRTRYHRELNQPEQRAAIKELGRLAHTKTLTLLYGASDTEHNQAVVLKELIEREGE